MRSYHLVHAIAGATNDTDLTNTLLSLLVNHRHIHLRRNDPLRPHVQLLVDHGVVCLAEGDHAGLRALVDRNFDLRTRIYDVGARDREMVALARRVGAAAKLCGSGGAILGVPAETGDLGRLERSFRERGFGFLVPRLTPPEASGA